jgi:hypothetical protein
VNRCDYFGNGEKLAVDTPGSGMRLLFPAAIITASTVTTGADRRHAALADDGMSWNFFKESSVLDGGDNGGNRLSTRTGLWRIGQDRGDKLKLIQTDRGRGSSRALEDGNWAYFAVPTGARFKYKEYAGASGRAARPEHDSLCSTAARFRGADYGRAAAVRR